MDFKWTPGLRQLYAELFVGLSRHAKRTWGDPMENGLYAGPIVGACQRVIDVFKSFGLTYDTVDEPIDIHEVKSGCMPLDRYPNSINGILPFSDEVIRGYFANTDNTPSKHAPNLLRTYIEFACEYCDPSLSSSTTEFKIHSWFDGDMKALVLNGYSVGLHGRYLWTSKMKPTFFACGLWNKDGIHRREERTQFANEFFAMHFDGKSIALAKNICAKYGSLQAAEALDTMYQKVNGDRTGQFLASLIYEAGWFDPFAQEES